MQELQPQIDFSVSSQMALHYSSACPTCGQQFVPDAKQQKLLDLMPLGRATIANSHMTGCLAAGAHNPNCKRCKRTIGIPVIALQNGGHMLYKSLTIQNRHYWTATCKIMPALTLHVQDIFLTCQYDQLLHSTTHTYGPRNMCIPMSTSYPLQIITVILNGADVLFSTHPLPVLMRVAELHDTYQSQYKAHTGTCRVLHFKKTTLM